MLAELHRSRIDSTPGTSGRSPQIPWASQRALLRIRPRPQTPTHSVVRVATVVCASTLTSAPTPTPPTAASFVLERLHEQQQEALLPLPLDTENLADDAMLANPLQRMERLSTGWFGVVMEYEGVLVPDTLEHHIQAWLKTADEFNYKRPLGHVMRRIKGVRDDVVVTRIFHWTSNMTLAKKVAARKMELYDSLRPPTPTVPLPDALHFLETLRHQKIPIALTCPLPMARLSSSLDVMGLKPYFSGVVSGEDSGSAEVELYYAYASQLIARPHARCVVVGESNTAVEAAHELGMKVIIMAGSKPVYNFSNADLVVRSLDQVSFINLKQLFANEELVQSRLPNESDDSSYSSSGSSTSDDDGFVGASAFGRDDYSFDDEEEDARYPLPW